MSAAIIFCIECQTSSVDVISWERHPAYRIATFRCHLCGHEAQVRGFTIGRPYLAESDPASPHVARIVELIVELAQLDMALPHEKKGAVA